MKKRKLFPVRSIASLIEEGAILENQDGNHGEKHPTSKDYVDDGIPFLMASDIGGDGKPDLKNCKFIPKSLGDSLRIGFAKEHDVLLTHKGSIGRVAIVPSVPDYVMLTPQVTYYRLDHSRLSNRFLCFAFRHPDFQSRMVSLSAQSTRPYIGITGQRQLQIYCPPFPTQRKIAGVLSAYDDLIENNTRRIAILEEMAQAIYREWFVNFRFPGHEKVKLINSPLGEIPEGWKATTLGDVVELAYGKALKADDRKPGPFPVYGSGGVVGFHDEAYTKGPGIIVGRKGNVGSVFWSDDDFYPIDTVFFVDTKVPLHYVYYNLSLSQSFLNSDAAVPGLNRNQAYRNPFVLPSRDVLTSFEDQCNTLFSALRNLRKRNDNLRTTRDLLLPKLISGQLDVEELDIETGEPLVEAEA